MYKLNDNKTTHTFSSRDVNRVMTVEKGDVYDTFPTQDEVFIELKTGPIQGFMVRSDVISLKTELGF